MRSESPSMGTGRKKSDGLVNPQWLFSWCSSFLLLYCNSFGPLSSLKTDDFYDFAASTAKRFPYIFILYPIQSPAMTGPMPSPITQFVKNDNSPWPAAGRRPLFWPPSLKRGWSKIKKGRLSAAGWDRVVKWPPSLKRGWSKLRGRLSAAGCELGHRWPLVLFSCCLCHALQSKVKY